MYNGLDQAHEDPIGPAKIRQKVEFITGAYERGKRQPVKGSLAVTQPAMVEAVLRPLAEVLTDVEAEFRRYVVGSDELYIALVLWVAHTHVFEVFDCTPYLHLTSPERQCGKTRALEVSKLLVARAVGSSSLTGPALFRTIEAERPTLLIDEADNVFRARDDSERLGDILGVLNDGFRRGGSVVRLVGKNHEPRAFSTYCPKIIASIGGLPDTLADRCVPLRLRRKLAHESVERFRYRVAAPQLEALRAQLGVAVAAHSDALGAAFPELPTALSDRQGDAWEPLFAIADAAGGNWPARVRAAAVELHAHGAETVVEPELLRDIREVFDADSLSRITSMELGTALERLDGSGWAEVRGGRGLTAYHLAKLLKPYGVAPLKTTKGWRGYERQQFEDAWRRYSS
jgi:hypothetical protein